MVARIRRLRSSARCSIRLMPGSSARSVTAERARSTKSAMKGGLGYVVRRGLIGSLLWFGCTGDGGKGLRDGGTGYGKASGRRHEMKVARGGDGQRFGGGLWSRLGSGFRDRPGEGFGGFLVAMRGPVTPVLVAEGMGMLFEGLLV